MKNYRATKTLLAFLSCCLIALSGMQTTDVYAQTDMETKIRLMSEALTARNAGDLETAKEKLEELRAIAPEDRRVEQLLATVEAEIEAAENDDPDVVVEPEPARPAVDTRRIDLWAQAIDARREGNIDEARRVAELIGEEYPQDTRVAPFLDGLADRRVALEEARRIETVSTEARAVLGSAPDWIAAGEHDRVVDEINSVLEDLPENVRTVTLIGELKKLRSEAVAKKALAQLKAGRIDEAEATLAVYYEFEETNRAAQQTAREVERGLDDPYYIPIDDVSPEFRGDRQRVRTAVRRGRAQFVHGDLQGAEDTFRRVEAMDPNNPQAKAFLRLISDERAAGSHLNRQKTRAQLLEEVADLWQRPQIFLDEELIIEQPEELPLEAKMREIVIPLVNFDEVPLRQVISTLNELNPEYDEEDGTGVNIVLRDPDRLDPEISIELRNLTLYRVLELILQDVPFRFEAQEDIVLVAPGEGLPSGFETDFFSVDSRTLIRITGTDVAGTPQQQEDDPFADPAPADAGPPVGETSQRIRSFLQAAGVSFPPQSSLVFDGSSIIVTNTRRNLDSIRRVLLRYADVRQVEIEARFLEVQQGALDELGFNYQVQGRGSPVFDTQSGLPIIDSSGNQVVGNFRQIFGSANRQLSGVQGGVTGSGGQVTIDSPELSLSIPQGPPDLPGQVPLGIGAPDLAVMSGRIGGYGVDAAIRALSRQTGSDLLSAPKVTVLSGETAQIVVAQELRYPESFSDPQSQVSQAGGVTAGATAAAGVTITAGTPQDFQSRNVGVELVVTPTVEDDERSITLDLHPQVTEFEGFVEFGGPSVAIQGDTTVTIPSGFFQPIFVSRSIQTKVTVWDGATLVMGGLTREEVRTIKDKVPVLGDIPLLGRLFRSEGEASSKRNLLIFVTANLVSPGGSLKNQELRNVSPGSTYQVPTHVTPGGPAARIRGD